MVAGFRAKKGPRENPVRIPGQSGPGIAANCPFYIKKNLTASPARGAFARVRVEAAVRAQSVTNRRSSSSSNEPRGPAAIRETREIL